MANSLTIKTDVYKGSRYFELVCTQKSNGSVENTSTITWTLYAKGDSTWYSTGPTTVIIGGTTVYSKARVDWENGKFPVAQGSTSGTVVIKHDNDGKKTIDVSFSTAVYNKTQKEYSDTWELDSIPRYATVAHSLNAKTETTVKMNWSSDSTIDYLWYSINNGSSWTGVNVTDGKSGTYTISGLAANTAYNIKTRVRRKDSQLTTDSSALNVTTYDYPYCTESPNFILGDAVTLKFYNPLSRAFKFYIIGNGTQIDVEYDCSSTTYTGVNSATSSVAYLYATIPNAKSAKYQVKVVYGTSTKTRNNGNTYTIKESVCYPTFSAFTYKDTNATVTAVTGNNQALVKGLSSLSVEIPAANKMVTKNSATPDYYGVSVDTISKTGKYNATSAVTISVGAISSAGAKRLNVRAYDSRGLSMLAYKDATVYDYTKPKINASATRLNNFEAQTTLKIGGEYTRLTIGGADKNTIKTVEYRIRETDGEWPTTYTKLTPTLSVDDKGKGVFSCANVTLSLDNAKAFEIEVKVTDSFNNLTVSTSFINVDIGQAVLFVSSNKRTCYLNGVEMVAADNVKQTKYYTQLADNTDLNTLVEIGTYRSTQLSSTNTMKNLPDNINGGFTLYVQSWTSSATNQMYRRQELVFSRFTFVRVTADSGATWGPWYKMALVEDLHPIGAVICTSTNANPSATYGGTWSLVDKGFKSYSVYTPSVFTAGTNVAADTVYLSRGGNTIRIRISVVINTAISDTGMSLGTLNWADVGITGLHAGIIEQLAYRDGANGGIVYSIFHESGEIQLVDVFDQSSIATGNTFYLDFTFVSDYTRMLDSACDKFYWKRTA